jgi:hypothetical protein
MASVVRKFFRTQFDGRRNCGDRMCHCSFETSSSLRLNACGKLLQADRRLHAPFSFASISNPNLHTNFAAVSKYFRRNPAIRFRPHPRSQRLQIGHPGLDSSLHPMVLLRGSVEMMPRANYRRQSPHHDVMGWYWRGE